MSAPQTVYVNVSSIAPNAVEPSSQLVQYSETRSVPIVPRASDYRAAIVRFQCTNVDVPMFIPRIKIGQPDPTLTVYRIGISVGYNGQRCDASAPVYYQP